MARGSQFDRRRFGNRRQEIGKPDRISYLLVCEGTRTEPLYFKELKTYLALNGSQVDIEIRGAGRSTLSLVEWAKKERARIEAVKVRKFDKLWVVFDKDNFLPQQFNEAINQCEREGIGCAWSNEAFELWYILHFEYRNSGMQRGEYKKRLEEILQKTNLGKKYRYEKNDERMFSLLHQYGSQNTAIENAEKLNQQYTDQNYVEHNPCTKVHELVKELQIVAKNNAY